MTVSDWERHTLMANTALSESDHLRCILHYQQALALSDQISDIETVELEDRLIISIVSCHNLAAFWRQVGNQDYELKYLELASEKVLTLIPQCGNSHCEAFVDSLGCCKKALIDFMKRHPNPHIARMVQDIDTASNCNLIAKFRLN